MRWLIEVAGWVGRACAKVSPVDLEQGWAKQQGGQKGVYGPEVGRTRQVAADVNQGIKLLFRGNLRHLQK